MTWEIEYYIEGNDSCPIEEFLDSIPIKHRAKVTQLIKRLEQDGPTLPFPFSSQVEGRLRELRTQVAKRQVSYLVLWGQDTNFRAPSWCAKAYG